MLRVFTSPTLLKVSPSACRPPTFSGHWRCKSRIPTATFCASAQTQSEYAQTILLTIRTSPTSNFPEINPNSNLSRGHHEICRSAPSCRLTQRLRSGPERSEADHAQGRAARTTQDHAQRKRLVCPRQHRRRRTHRRPGQLERQIRQSLCRTARLSSRFLEFRPAGKIQRRARTKVQRRQQRNLR